MIDHIITGAGFFSRTEPAVSSYREALEYLDLLSLENILYPSPDLLRFSRQRSS